VTNRKSDNASVDEQLDIVSRVKSRRKKRKNKRDDPGSSPLLLKLEERFNEKEEQPKKIIGRMAAEKRLKAREEKAKRLSRARSEMAERSRKKKDLAQLPKSQQIWGLKDHVLENHKGSIESMGQDITGK
jgi:hypothetical protein